MKSINYILYDRPLLTILFPTMPTENVDLPTSNKQCFILEIPTTKFLTNKTLFLNKNNRNNPRSRDNSHWHPHDSPVIFLSFLYRQVSILSGIIKKVVLFSRICPTMHGRCIKIKTTCSLGTRTKFIFTVYIGTYSVSIKI